MYNSNQLHTTIISLIDKIMNKHYLFLIIALYFFSNSVIAQRGTLKGRLIDSVSHQSLSSASITVLDAQDSTLEVFGLSHEDGSFELKNISMGTFLVKITFQGYKTFRRKIALNKEKLLIDLGDVYLKIKTNELEEVIVTESPIVIKKDTIEYNAGSFKTKPNAVVEDLLKKLPGVEVAKNGTITAQGETVQRVLVDGKRFFGDDPKMATRNLPPDVVDKIQVYDAQSDQSTFSGFDDGSRTKTINITTKKDKRKGYFGKAMAGGGNEGRYESSLNLSRFNNNQQLSLLAEGNDINKQAFSVQDILGVAGRGGGGGGIGGLGGGNSSNGITTIWAGGLNYRDVWGKKTDAYGSGFYNNVAINNQSNSLTQRFGNNPDSTQFANLVTSSLNKNQNYRFNYNIELPIDSNNSMIIRPNGSYQESTVNTHAGTNTTIKADTISKVNQQVNTENKGYNGTIEVLFRHRFHKKGQTISIHVNGGGNSNDGTGFNNSITNFQSFNNVLTRKVDQQNITASNAQNIGATVSYTHPIAKNQLLELGANHNYSISTSNKNTYAPNSLGDYNVAVDSLTNNFENINESSRLTLGYRLQNAKFNLGITNGVQFANLSSTNRTNDTMPISRSYTNMYPTLNFMYNFTRTTNLRINYNGRTSAPSLTQLQPVPDNSNQTNITTGNPDLKQAFVSSLRLFFSSFDVFKLRNIFAMVNFNATNNGIISSITQYTSGPKAGTQRTTYVNKSGAYSVNGFFNYGFQLDNPKSNLNFTTNFSNSRNLSIINDVTNNTYNTTIGETVRWTMNINEKFDLNFNSNSSYSMAKNSLLPQTNTHYFSQSFWIEPSYTFNGGWVFSNDFTYTYYSGRTSGYNLSVPLWNAYISKLLFKKKNGELKLAMYDILNKNASVTRTVTNNTIQDIQGNVLKQYFSLTFAYNLRNFAGQAQQAMPSFFRGSRSGGGGQRN